MVRAQGVGGQGVEALGGKGVKDVREADRAGEAGVPEGYKRTEVGVVPVEWEVVSLGMLFKFKNGINASKEQYGSGYKFVNVLDIIENVVLTHDDIIGRVNVDISTFERYKVEFGDVLFQRSSETIEDVGQAIVYVDKEKPATFGGFIILGKKIGKFDSVYVNYQLKSFALRKQVTSRSGGSTRYNIGQPALREVNLPLPPLPEQRAIAGALGEADALLAALDGLIAKKAAVKQATLEELLSGRRRLGGYEGKHSEHNLSDWQKIEIGKIAKCYSGGTPSSTNDQYYGGAVNWITSSELNQRFIKQTAGTITEVGLEESSAKLVEPYSLLLALYGATAGTPAITMISGAINQAVLCIECLCDVYYLFYWLECNKEYVINTYTQGGQPNLSGNIVKDIVVNLPPQVEQRAIATLLTTLDDELTALRARREKLAAVKAGMMEQLLTGAVRLV